MNEPSELLRSCLHRTVRAGENSPLLVNTKTWGRWEVGGWALGVGGSLHPICFQLRWLKGVLYHCKYDLFSIYMALLVPTHV